MADHIIEITELTKRYNGVHALAGLNLRIPRGALCGLLGRNGAGKTTTVKVLLGMVRPTSGDARVFGLAVTGRQTSVAIRSRTAFVSDDKDLYDAFTVGDMIRFTARFYPHWRKDLAQDYLRKFELPAQRAVKELSRGMRTKLALLLAFSSGAELLILDEPTSGLDPVATEEVLQTLVSHVARQETTVLFSSHQLSDVEQIADRIALIDRGRTVLEGALEDIRENYRRIEFTFAGQAPALELGAPGIVSTRRQGRVLSVLVSADAERVIEAARALRPVNVDSRPVTLKEIFLDTVAAEG